MDPTLYRDVTTTRGLKYSVYYSKGTDASKPTLLFLHGYPSSSYDWRHQVAYFQPLGYGIIVPDMLGYGNTDKPTDASLYAGSLLAQDMLDVLEIDPGTQVVVIGHDWGSKVVSRIANIDSDRILGFACIAVGYYPPNPIFTYPQFLAATTQLAGYELFGYWSFFAEDGADKIIMEHFDSFMAAIVGGFGDGEEAAKTHFAKTGGLKAWLLAGNPPPALPSYLTQEEFETQKEILRKTGMTGPLCWYKVAVSSFDMEDSKKIPQEKYNIQKPVFFGAANQDVIAIPAFGKASVDRHCPNATIKYYDAGHWVIWTPPARDELNADLVKWIADISSS